MIVAAPRVAATRGADRVDRAEAGRGQGDEYLRVVSHGGRYVVMSTAQAGVDELPGITRVQIRARRAHGGAPVVASREYLAIAAELIAAAISSMITTNSGSAGVGVWRRVCPRSRLARACMTVTKVRRPGSGKTHHPAHRSADLSGSLWRLPCAAAPFRRHARTGSPLRGWTEFTATAVGVVRRNAPAHASPGQRVRSFITVIKREPCRG
jgi:hypothetical protein